MEFEEKPFPCRDCGVIVPLMDRLMQEWTVLPFCKDCWRKRGGILA